MITIIYGPSGSGKTKNANYLKGKYAAKRIIDEWDGDLSIVKDGDLLLTNKEFIYVPGSKIIHISEALRK